MKVTSNFDLQKKDYLEVAPHNHRVKSKTRNHNIDWSLTKYDILNQHPSNFRNLMIIHWGAYAFDHDLKRIKSGHINDTYGDYRRPEVRALQNKVINSLPKATYKSFKKNLPKLRTRYAFSELLKSVHGMFQRKNKIGYRTFETGFARGTNHKNQIGADRRQIWKRIHAAYPALNNEDILQSEARGLNQVPGKMNQMMPGFRITDYDVHVDEKKHYFGQAHLQGRIALLGKTKKGKPSFNLNNSIKASVVPHQKLLKQLDKKYYPKNYGTKKDHMNFRNNVGRFHAFNMLASYITFSTEAQQLEHDFPKAHLDFHLIRTYSPSVNHTEYIHQQDQKRRTQSSVNRVTKRAQQHLKNSYASLQAKWLNKKRASLAKDSEQVSVSASAKASTAQSIQSSADLVTQRASKSAEDSASEAVSNAWDNIRYHDSLLDQRNINLLTRFMTVTQANNANVQNHSYNLFASNCYQNGLTYPNGQKHSGNDLMVLQQSEATSIINRRFSNVTDRESANHNAVKSASKASESVSSAVSSISNQSSNLQTTTANYYRFKNRNINRLSSLLGSSEVTIYGIKTTADVLYDGGMDVNHNGHPLSQADLVDYLITQKQKKRKRVLKERQRQLNQERSRINEFRVARRKMMRQQFSLIVPKSYKIKGMSREKIIDKMVQGVSFKGKQLGDNKFHKGFDLEVHFVGYDLQHGLDANVQRAKNEIDDYEKNTPQK